jgi:hypothetical protein
MQIKIIITIITTVVIIDVAAAVVVVVVVVVVVHIFKLSHGYVFDYSKTGEYVSIYSFG